MTNVFASAAKAYLSGFRPSDTNSMMFSFATVNTSAVAEVQKMALVGNKPFFVASSIIVGLLVVLLGALVAITRPDQLESFDLENIVRKLR
jgi:p-aminobenzoyl-glutamate transporter AbgT